MLHPTWESPWFGTNDFAFAVGPEVDSAAYEVIQSGIGGLVKENRRETGEWKPEEAQLQRSLNVCSGEQTKRKFVRETDEAHDEVDGLEYRYRLDGAVEVLGQKVEEDLGPEEAFYAGCDLIWRGKVSEIVMRELRHSTYMLRL